MQDCGEMDCYSRTMNIIKDRRSGDDYQLCRAFSDMKSDLNGFTDYLQLSPAMFYGIIIGFFVVEVILMHINTQISRPPFGARWKGRGSTNHLTHFTPGYRLIAYRVFVRRSQNRFLVPDCNILSGYGSSAFESDELNSVLRNESFR